MIELIQKVTARVFEKPDPMDWPGDLSTVSLLELDRRFGRALQREVTAAHARLRFQREAAEEWAARREQIEREVRRRLGPAGRTPAAPVL